MKTVPAPDRIATSPRPRCSIWRWARTSVARPHSTIIGTTIRMDTGRVPPRIPTRQHVEKSTLIILPAETCRILQAGTAAERLQAGLGGRRAEGHAPFTDARQDLRMTDCQCNNIFLCLSQRLGS